MVCPDMLVTMSPGLLALPSGRFSVAGMMPTTLIGSLSWATALNAPSTLAAPLMSYFISSISAAGLREMPPASKVTPLPTSTTGFCFLIALVVQNNQLGRLAAAARNGKQRTHFQGFHVFLFQHFNLELVGFCQFLRLLGQIGRGADVARQVAEILGQVHAVGDRQASLGSFFADAQFGAARHVQDDAAQRAAHLFLLAFQAVEAVNPFHRHQYGLLDFPCGVAALDREFGEENRGFKSTRIHSGF